MALTERLAIILEATGAGAVIRDFDKVGGAAKGLGDKTSKASGILGQLGPVGQQAGGMLASGLIAGVAAAGAALVTFGATAVQSYTDLTRSVLQFVRASGATPEQASVLIAAFDDVGISAEVATKSIFQLGKRVTDNAAELAQHGVAATYDAQGNIDLAETLLNVADAYVATTDPAARAQLITDAFGKSGQQLIPILERGREGIEALFSGAASTGQIVTRDELDKLIEYDMAMDDLQDSLKAVALAAGKFLVPLLTKAADVMTTLVDRARDIGDIPILGWALKKAAEGFDMVTGSSGPAAAGLGEIDDKTKQLLRDLEEEKKALNETSDALLATSAAQRAYDNSLRAVAKAERDVTEAREDYNKLLAQGAVDEEKVADARRSLNEATRSLGSAQRELTRSQEEYNDAQAAFLALPTDTNAEKLSEASDNLADAQDGVASAAEREKDAARDLDRALAGDPEFNDKLADAKQRVADAEQNHADAQYNSSQRAFELEAALTTQNTLLSENAAAVGTIRAEWEALLARKPEIAAFLAGPLGALLGAPPAAPPPAPGPIPQGPGDYGGGGDFADNKEGGVAGTVRTVGDIIINVKDAVTDPAGLARRIVWELW